jgi:hypothetical protein
MRIHFGWAVLGRHGLASAGNSFSIASAWDLRSPASGLEREQ